LIVELAKVDENAALDSYGWVVTKKMHRVRALSMTEARELVAALEIEGAVPKGFDPKDTIDSSFVERAKR
jgi:hypothetical protein